MILILFLPLPQSFADSTKVWRWKGGREEVERSYFAPSDIFSQLCLALVCGEGGSWAWVLQKLLPLAHAFGCCRVSVALLLGSLCSLCNKGVALSQRVPSLLKVESAAAVAITPLPSLSSSDPLALFPARAFFSLLGLPQLLHTVADLFSTPHLTTLESLLTDTPNHP